MALVAARVCTVLLMSPRSAIQAAPNVPAAARARTHVDEANSRARVECQVLRVRVGTVADGLPNECHMLRVKSGNVASDGLPNECHMLRVKSGNVVSDGRLMSATC